MADRRTRPQDGDDGSTVERTLQRCLQWSQAGRHRKVLTEVERVLPLTHRQPLLQARLLVWKATALLSMGAPDRALAAASRSWDLDATSYACHLMSCAFDAIGDHDRSEELLRMGWQLFPDAIHLPVQLGMLLADQDRVPEALEVLETLGDPGAQTGELQVFLVGLRANLMAKVGRWAEADEVLQEGLGLYPDAELLHETRSALGRVRARAKATSRLAASWLKGLGDLQGVAAEVDDAVVRLGSAGGFSELTVLAARRLWRAFYQSERVQLHSPDAWGGALLCAVSELDGGSLTAAAVSRLSRAHPSTVRAAVNRFRSYLSSLEPEFAARSFAAESNPRLATDTAPAVGRTAVAEVLRFPGPTSEGA